MSARVLQVHAAPPRPVLWQGEVVSTGIFKAPVEGPVRVGWLNVEGDRQADLGVHGGWQKAVYCYAAEDYERWRAERPDLDLSFGAFGENLTLAGLAQEPCVGDRLRIGTVELVVTEPRLPCFKLGIKVGDDDFPNEFLARGRFGFYCAVAQPGSLAAGDDVVVVGRHPARLPVRSIGLVYRDGGDAEAVRRLVETEAVPENWRSWFARRARVEPEPPAPAWDGYRPLVVSSKRPETVAVTSLTLAAPDGSPLPDYRPGQHITLRVPAGEGGAPVVRSYSLSDAPRGDGYRLTVKRIGLVSSFLHDALGEGDAVEAQAPSGAFWVDPAQNHRPVVLAGAGIGLTPLVAMVEAIAAAPRPRETWLFLGARSEGEHPLRERLGELAAAHDHIRLHVLYSRNGGRITTALLRGHLPASYFDYYLCGPAGFMQSLYDGLLDWGVPEHRIHYEAFGPATVLRAAAADVGRVGSRVAFARSGVAATWDEPGSSLLELAERHGVTIPFGCRAGSCGTCATAVEGEIAYLHAPSAPRRPGCALPCVAVPAGAAVSLDA